MLAITVIVPFNEYTKHLKKVKKEKRKAKLCIRINEKWVKVTLYTVINIQNILIVYVSKICLPKWR